MILLIDNYDSFTYNLAHLIGGLGETVEVRRNAAISAEDALNFGAKAIFISPGPGAPESAGICLDLISGAVKTKTPVFGVCLGMQAIAQAFGGRIRRADRLMHGKTCGVVHENRNIFAGLPASFAATRYHSLVADPGSMPDTLETIAVADDDQEIMAIAHKSLPITGVQFHPESIASEHGGEMVKNFLDQTVK